MEAVIGISRYFNENTFAESLVLEFVYDDQERTVTLICDYANDVVQALMNGRKPPLSFNGVVYHRDLRKLIFGDVTEYIREIGTNKKLIDLKSKYLAKGNPPVTIQVLDITPTGSAGVFRMKIWFGDFGGCIFNFAHFSVKRKLVRSIEVHNDAEGQKYIDVNSMQEIDFYDPFRSPSA